MSLSINLSIMYVKITATSYKNNFDTIALSPLEVIGIFNFRDFHIPVIVSTNMAKAIRNNIPDIGMKKVDTTANNLNDDFCIDDNKMANCVFMKLVIVPLLFYK